jgi:pyrroloquinoline-quinone synthase
VNTAPAADTRPWSREEFEARLREHGSAYHINHPFQALMNEGRLDQRQMQGWVANRFYYQLSIPLKDAAVLSNCPDREVRREWIKRIADHDGAAGTEGGIERWLALADAVGLSRDECLSLTRVLPGVRFAVDAYVHFARTAPWQESVAASLTELFASDIHRQRIESWPRNYPWIRAEGLAYFRKRLDEAPRDVQHGLRLTLEHFATRAQQERALQILRFKLDILWSMLDAMWIAYLGYRPAPGT